eukprot:792507-Prorocentrum_lima.AAC.1
MQQTAQFLKFNLRHGYIQAVWQIVADHVDHNYAPNGCKFFDTKVQPHGRKRQERAPRDPSGQECQSPH